MALIQKLRCSMSLGGSLGRAVSKELAEAGARVFLTGRGLAWI